MNLVHSIHACTDISLYTAAVHTYHPVFSIYKFLIHLLVLVYHLFFRRIAIFNALFKKLNGLSGFLISPIIIISSKKVDKFSKFIINICFFPGTAIGISSLSPIIGKKLIEIFLCFYLSKPCFLQPLLINPESQDVQHIRSRINLISNHNRFP